MDPFVLRACILFVYGGALLGTAAGVAFGVYTIFSRRRADPALIPRAGHAMLVSLGLMWSSGLLLITMDNGLGWAALMARPMLLAQTTVVLVLSANALILQRAAFPRLPALHGAPIPSPLIAIGTLSIAVWVYTAVLGVALPLATLLGYIGFMVVYVGLMVAGVALGLHWLRPRRRTAEVEDGGAAGPETGSFV